MRSLKVVEGSEDDQWDRHAPDTVVVYAQTRADLTLRMPCGDRLRVKRTALRALIRDLEAVAALGTSSRVWVEFSYYPASLLGMPARDAKCISWARLAGGRLEFYEVGSQYGIKLSDAKRLAGDAVAA